VDPLKWRVEPESFAGFAFSRAPRVEKIAGREVIPFTPEVKGRSEGDFRNLVGGKPATYLDRNGHVLEFQQRYGPMGIKMGTEAISKGRVHIDWAARAAGSVGQISQLFRRP
jgi:hypothetical protein